MRMLLPILACWTYAAFGRRTRTTNQNLLNSSYGEHQDEVGGCASLKILATLLQGGTRASGAWQAATHGRRLLPQHHRHAAVRSQLRIRKPPPADGSEEQKKRPALLILGYTGTNYYGLESQQMFSEGKRLPTVSDTVRQALLKEGFIRPSNFEPLSRTKWTCASRTDKGVHAAFAAVSLRLETLKADLIEQDELAAAGDPAALLYNAAQEAHDRPTQLQMAPPWQLSPAALARINAALPADVRLFSGCKVSKKFDARLEASARVYEYLLPLSAVGASAEELDAVLRTFEGTHRMHNFASGLRLNQNHAKIFRGKTGEDGNMVTEVVENQATQPAEGNESVATRGTVDGLAGDYDFAWECGVDASTKHSQAEAYRSVLSCRVSRSLQIDGEEYLVLRISGLAFVLHQIRHMVGAALAVTNGVVPLDVMRIALETPLRIDVSPLAPGLGLLLDEISWWNYKKGSYDVHVPPSFRAASDDFKEGVIYPHIHRLYQSGAFGEFLAEYIRYPSNSPWKKFYNAEEYDMIRRVGAAWGSHAKQISERRRAEIAAAGKKIGADSGKLPGGLYVAVCQHFQVMPGPATHKAMDLLRDKKSRGELDDSRRQDWSYYISVLEAENLPGLSRKEENREAELALSA